MKKSFVRENLIINILITFILTISFVMIFWNLYREGDSITYNKARILAADQLKQLESCIFDNQFKKLQYPYMVLDLEGTVLYADDKWGVIVGDKVNLKEILQLDYSFSKMNQGYEKYSFILTSKGSAKYFVGLLFRKCDLYPYSNGIKILIQILPILIGGLLVIGILFIRSYLLKKRFIQPVKEINQSAKAIITGNYEVEVRSTHNQNVLHTEIGELSYYFELMRDELKENRESELALKRSQKELISCISHDLKTPISSIKAYSEGLRDGLAKDEEKRIHYANIIVNKTEVLTKMMNDLLEHSNAELNELSIHKMEVYSDEFFGNLKIELEPYVEQRGIRLIWKNELPNAIINMDTDRITQVVYNLVENSMKYAKEKDREITVFLQRLEENIEVSVIDNGIGIGNDDIQFIFNKFYRAEKSRSMRIPGSGLGLSICQYIINAHNGSINCESKPGKGTTFKFTLPIV